MRRLSTRFFSIELDADSEDTGLQGIRCTATLVAIVARHQDTHASFCTLTHSHTHGRFRMQLHPRAGYWPGYYCRCSFFSPRREADRHSLHPSPLLAASTASVHLLALVPVQACAIRPPTAPTLHNAGSISTTTKAQRRPRQALPAPLSALPTRTYRPSCTLR